MKNWKSKKGPKVGPSHNFGVSAPERESPDVNNKQKSYGVPPLFKGRQQHSSKLSPLFKEHCAAHKCLSNFNFLALFHLIISPSITPGSMWKKCIVCVSSNKQKCAANRPLLKQQGADSVPQQAKSQMIVGGNLCSSRFGSVHHAGRFMAQRATLLCKQRHQPSRDTISAISSAHSF